MILALVTRVDRDHAIRLIADLDSMLDVIVEAGLPLVACLIHVITEPNEIALEERACHDNLISLLIFDCLLSFSSVAFILQLFVVCLFSGNKMLHNSVGGTRSRS